MSKKKDHRQAQAARSRAKPPEGVRVLVYALCAADVDLGDDTPAMLHAMARSSSPVVLALPNGDASPPSGISYDELVAYANHHRYEVLLFLIGPESSPRAFLLERDVELGGDLAVAVQGSRRTRRKSDVDPGATPNGGRESNAYTARGRGRALSRRN